AKSKSKIFGLKANDNTGSGISKYGGADGFDSFSSSHSLDFRNINSNDSKDVFGASSLGCKNLLYSLSSRNDPAFSHNCGF
ncbi:20656_t:CDS:1, partial [Entrophospora sp. SA101]